MKYDLVKRVCAEEKRALEIWGATDDSPGQLLNAAVEELGEVAHALNHDEGVDKARLEIVHTIGILSRLDQMLEARYEYTIWRET